MFEELMKTLNRIANALEVIVLNIDVEGKTEAPSIGGAPAPAVDPMPSRIDNPKSAPAKPRAAKTTAVGAAVTLTVDDCIASLRALVIAKGNPAGPTKAKEILTKYGVGKVSELNPEQYAAFHKDMTDAAK